MTAWTVLSRAECSLCEQLLAELAEELSPAEAAQVTRGRCRPAIPSWSVNTVTGCQFCWPTATSSATTGWIGQRVRTILA